MAIAISGLICRSSSAHKALTRRSCSARMYRMGTPIWSTAPRTSHASTARSRAANTSGFTEATPARTALNSDGDASAPTSQRRTAIFGIGTWKITGASNEARNLRQPRTGLVANPAHRTIPCRFAGFVAAYLSARGVEKDSAISMNGSEIGQATRTKFSISEYGRYRSVG